MRERIWGKALLVHETSLRSRAPAPIAKTRRAISRSRHDLRARVYGLGITRTVVSPPSYDEWNGLLTVSTGAAIVRTGTHVTAVFRGRGIVLGDERVEVEARERVDLRIIYVGHELPHAGSVVGTSELLHALIERAVACGYLDPAVDRQRHLLQVLHDECARLQPSRQSLSLPLPSDRAVFERGYSTRTLQRIFRRETGMGIATWRRRVALLNALTKIAQGERVANAAYDCGYATPSAFIHASRREFGDTPLSLVRRVS